LVSGTGILRKISDGSGSYYLAASRKSFARQHFCKSAFASTISANKTDAISMVNSDRHIFHKKSRTST
jgi:hypothetical protein